MRRLIFATFHIITLFSILFYYGCSGAKSDNNHDDSTSTTQMNFTGAKDEIKLITLDPGHFHAYLVQKRSYKRVDSVAHVFAPEGNDVQRYLHAIKQFNTRKNNPTNWDEKVYTGADFLQKMVSEKPGNVVVIAGNNAKKTRYIKESIDAGLNVLADKPMVIKPEKFPLLKQAFKDARKNGVLLYDIMTERYEITTILQQKISQFPGVFGELVKGSPENPAIIQQSVHRFFKNVAGEPLTRPTWFFDADQQGESIVNVSTHLVDLAMFEAFPKKPIETTDVEMLKARHWTTNLNPSQFERITGVKKYPDFLQKQVTQDSILKVYSNSEFTFRMRDVYAKIAASWHYEKPKGGDTHYAIMHGTKANLVIRQGEKQNYEPKLYIEPVNKASNRDMRSDVENAITKIDRQYPGVSVSSNSDGWEVKIPDKYRVGHEAHFAQVMKKYFQYLEDGKLPDWERQNMITKYFLTTRAYELSQ